MIRLRVMAVELITPDDINLVDLRAAAVDAVRLVGLSLRVEGYDDVRLLGSRDLSALSALTDTVVSLLEAAHTIERSRR